MTDRRYIWTKCDWGGFPRGENLKQTNVRMLVSPCSRYPAHQFAAVTSVKDHNARKLLSLSRMSSQAILKVHLVLFFKHTILRCIAPPDFLFKRWYAPRTASSRGPTVYFPSKVSDWSMSVYICDDRGRKVSSSNLARVHDIDCRRFEWCAAFLVSLTPICSWMAGNFAELVLN